MWQTTSALTTVSYDHKLLIKLLGAMKISGYGLILNKLVLTERMAE
jgi:hypothetical protein